MASGEIKINQYPEYYANQYYLDTNSKSLQYSYAKYGDNISFYSDNLDEISDIKNNTTYPKQFHISLGSVARAYRPVQAYVILPVFSKASPYLQVGTLWISNAGNIDLYATAASSTDIPRYVFGSYVTAM
jgi:hypothetical protein